MPEYKGCSAWITIEGEVAPEYALQTSEEEDQVECWIASDAGKHFSVHFDGSGEHFGATARQAKIFVDGIGVGALPADKPHSICSVSISASERRKLAFSALTLTDDDNYQDVALSGSFGTISVEIWSVERISCSRKPRKYTSPAFSQVVHETSKKAGNHCIALGGVERYTLSKRSLTRRNIYLDKLLTFSFSYRPLALLQANGIAPRPRPVDAPETPPQSPITITDSPPPPSIIDEEASSELNHLREQMQQVRSRMDALSSTQEAGPRKKRPLVEAKGRDLKRVKTEMAAFNPRMEGVIDLTGD